MEAGDEIRESKNRKEEREVGSGSWKWKLEVEIKRDRKTEPTAQSIILSEICILNLLT